MSVHDSFEFNEKYLSQIPALQLIINMGFEYLTPDQALKNRQGKKSNIILENILSEQLRKINKIQFKGKNYPAQGLWLYNFLIICGALLRNARQIQPDSAI